jgi:site-specific DNA-methyltransferase (adenine-specific)
MEQALNELFCEDNLLVLRERLATESVDLIYLDPPFYSQRNYQAVLRDRRGLVRAQAFIDVWRWGEESEQWYKDVLSGAIPAAGRALVALRALLGPGSLLAYLVAMTVRLVELYRVLKPTGSVYLHCDPAAGHYLKLVLDAIFEAGNFRNEIIWSYKTGGASRRNFARKHDLIFFYSKSDKYTFHLPKEKSYMMHRYGFKKSTFLHDGHGDYTWVNMKDVWELPALGAADGQRLGFPTQKPEPLLERIIVASSNEGDVVLDPFCGSGTTLVVAQRLGRNWLGIESHFLGVASVRYRLWRQFPGLRYAWSGGPVTVADALTLARKDARQFRWWILALNVAPLMVALTLPMVMQLALLCRPPGRRWQRRQRKQVVTLNQRQTS